MCVLGVEQLTFYNNNIHNEFHIGSLKYQTINHVVHQKSEPVANALVVSMLSVKIA